MATNGGIAATDTYPFYEGMTKADIGKLESKAKQIRSVQKMAVKTTVEAGFKIGQMLLDARDVFVGKNADREKKDHADGRFSKWVKARCEFSDRTGQRAMNVVEIFKEPDTVSGSFEWGALQKVAAESVLDDTREAIVDKAKKLTNGDTIAQKDVVAMINEMQPKPEKEFNALEATSKLHRIIMAQARKWPKYAREALADQLKSLAQDIQEMPNGD